MADRAGARDVGEHGRRRITGQHEHGSVWCGASDGTRNVRAGAVRQVVIAQHDIRPQPRGRGDSARDVVDHVDDLHVLRAAEGDAHELREEPFVVDHEDAQRSAHRAASIERTCAASAATTAGSSSPCATAL